jgi:tripartite-type tricarboxylate transporter receptor subunit TctC
MPYSFSRRVVLAGAAALLSCAAFAQQWPAKPVTLVVPFAAGGPTDTLGRILAERAGRSLGQTVVVENVAGAGGVIANNRVLKSAPDGYTIEIGHIGTHVLTQAVQGLKVDYVNDFEPICMLATNPQVMLARNDFPARTLQELVAYVKANPGKVSYATGGVGTPSHIMAASFSDLVAPLNIVHYKGAAPAMQDVMAGHADISFDQAATGVGFAKSGKLRAFAVTAKQRLESAPDVPTVDEAGMPGFYMTIWHGVWAPKGTPQPVIARLNAACRETLADPAIRKRFGELGQEIPSPDQQSPEALRAFHKAEVDKWHQVIRAAGIKAN